MAGNMTMSEAIRWQAQLSARNGAPATARVITAMLAAIGEDTLVGRRLSDWPAISTEQAVPLRLTGGLHYLLLSGADRRLAPVYAGEVVAQETVDALVCAVIRDHDQALLPWLDGPPQTNEAGRSASIVAGLAWLAARGVGRRFSMLEIGASAGCNTMIERYRYDLGGVCFGPAASPVIIAPEWRGPPPPRTEFQIAMIRGCDQAPIDLADPEQALRLAAYVWPENTARMERLKAIVALARANPPRLDRADAADWVEARLAEPGEAGVARVLYHSIVWQYLPPEGRARIEAAMTVAGARASADSPLCWVRLETNRETFRHELSVRFWPGGGEWRKLGEAHPHGAWVEWPG